MTGPAPTSLIGPDVVIRVSSTLDKSVGKKFLTDGSNETCWTSANGLPQHVTLSFPAPVRPTALSLTFAGGFVGTHCSLSSCQTSARKEWTVRHRFYPADSNKRQDFALESAATIGTAAGEIDDSSQEWRIEFEKGSDFFGRITVYDLEVLGWRS